MEEELQYLEDFLMEIELLDQIEAQLSKFNVFETLSMFHNEIRHSNVLSWLMKPKDNHGLGDIFLKKVITTNFSRESSIYEELRIINAGINYNRFK